LIAYCKKITTILKERTTMTHNFSNTAKSISIVSILLLVTFGSLSGMLFQLPNNEQANGSGNNLSISLKTPRLQPSNSPGNSNQTGDEWPMFRGSLNHTGVATTTPAGGTGPLWTYNSGDGDTVVVSPAIAGGRVFAGTFSGVAFCLNASSGKSIWNYSSGIPGANVWGSPAVAGNSVYFVIGDHIFPTWGKVICINTATGKSVWNCSLGDFTYSSPAIAGGFVYVGCYNGKLACINATTGKSVWNSTWIGAIASAPAVVAGRVFVGCLNYKLCCLNATTGKSAWNITTGDWVFSSPAVAGGFVYVGCNDHKVYCVNAITGRSVWNSTTGDEVLSSPAIAGGFVYVGSMDHKVHCLDATTGKSVWNSTMGNAVNFSPVIAGGVVYAGDDDRLFSCLNAATGKSLWNFTTGVPAGESLYSSPAIAGGRVYFQALDSNLYCFPMNPLPAPQNVQSFSGNAQVTLTWQAPATTYGGIKGSPVTSYNIYRGSSPSNVAYYGATGNVTYYTDWYAQPGHAYYYQICAVNAMGAGLMSIEVPAAPFGIPTAPRGLQASVSNGHVMLSWETPFNTGGLSITNYTIYRSTTMGNEAFLITISTTTAYTDVNVAINHVYYYTVSAINAAGEGPQSVEASATPASVPSVPRNLVTTTDDGKVMLSWQIPATNGGLAIMNYYLYRGTSPGNEAFYTILGNETAYIDTGISNTQAYYYKITAVNGVGEGPQGNEASTIPLSSPGSPRNVQLTAGDQQVTLIWQIPENNGGSAITGYKIYRSTSSGAEIYLVTVGNFTSYTDKGLVNGQVYYYTISTVNSVGEGSRSAETFITATSSGNLPSNPSTDQSNLTLLATGLAIAGIVGIIVGTVLGIASILALKQKKTSRSVPSKIE